LQQHSFHSIIVRRRIRLDHHLPVRHLNHHLILLPRYEWADAVNKVAMNRSCGVVRAFVKLITRHNVGVHDPIVVNHVQGVNDAPPSSWLDPKGSNYVKGWK
jgi:hypothetical protein